MAEKKEVRKQQSQAELEAELKGLTVEQKERVLRRNKMAGMSQAEMVAEKRERAGVQTKK